MIQSFYYSKKKQSLFNNLFDLILKHSNIDFYLTKNNIRYYMVDQQNLKLFLNEIILSYVIEEKGDYDGFIGVLKSIGGGKKRYYIKLIAKNFKIAQQLLNVLLWNFDADLYIKINKNSTFVSAFKNKGFRFKAGRGVQLLLYRKYINKPKKIIIKKDI